MTYRVHGAHAQIIIITNNESKYVHFCYNEPRKAVSHFELSFIIFVAWRVSHSSFVPLVQHFFSRYFYHWFWIPHICSTINWVNKRIATIPDMQLNCFSVFSIQMVRHLFFPAATASNLATKIAKMKPTNVERSAGKKIVE